MMRRRRWRRVTRLHFGIDDATRASVGSIDARVTNALPMDLSAESLLPELPRAVDTFTRRFLTIALEACAPPVSESLRVKLRRGRGVVRVEVIAMDREAYSRMVVAPLTGVLLADLSRWTWAFASSFRIEHNRRGHVRIRVAVVVDPDEHATRAGRDVADAEALERDQ